MTIFDLLFLVLFLAGAGALLGAATRALRGRRAEASTLLRRWAAVAAGYMAVVVLVSLVSPQRYLPAGEPQCSDDWCIAATGAERSPGPEGTRITVGFRIFSRARAVAQRERFVSVYLRDARGRRYNPVAEPGAVPFDTLLAPAQEVIASRTFVVPAGAAISGLVVAREGAGRIPGCCIIGDESSLLHKRTIVRLDS